jgi:hypothetical protein
MGRCGGSRRSRKQALAQHGEFAVNGEGCLAMVQGSRSPMP